jgi:hypothetical protein
MSRPPQYETNELVLALQGGSTVARRSLSVLRRQLQAAGFWTAVALPFLHVPLLLSGLDTPSDTWLFVALISLNLLALLIGHGYDPD